MANIKQIAVFKKPEGSTGEWKVYDVGTVAEAVGISPITGLSTTADNVQNALETLNGNFSTLTSNINSTFSILTENIDNKVSKLGDTMSGSLNINHIDNMPTINFKSGLPEATIGNTKVSSVSLGFAGLFFNDYNGIRVGRLESRIVGTNATDANPKGQTYMSLSAIGGTTANKVTNQLVLRVDPNGTSKVTFSHPQAWRNGMGVVFSGLSTVASSTAEEAIKFAMNSSESPYIRLTSTTGLRHQLVMNSDGLYYQRSNKKPNGQQTYTQLFRAANYDKVGKVINQTAISSANNVTTVSAPSGTYVRFPQKLVIPEAGNYLITAEGHFPNSTTGSRRIIIHSTASGTPPASTAAAPSNVFQKVWAPAQNFDLIDRITSIETFNAATNLYLYLYQNSNTTMSNVTGLLRAMQVR